MPDSAPDTDCRKTPEIVALLRSHGLRATRTRCLLLAVLAESNAHPTAEDIVRVLRERGQSMGVATAYQNLSALAEKGLLVRFMGRDGRSRFDGNLAPHHHLICSRCGRTVDVDADVELDEITPASEDRELADWQIEARRLDFLGTCPACRGQA